MGILGRERKVIDGGILTSATGPVHLEVGNHRTRCGQAIPLRAAPVSDAQVMGFDLPVCAQCYPDGHGRGGNPHTPGRHRTEKGGTR